MKNNGLNINKLRKLLSKFYAEHDPERFYGGFDINGLAEFTMERGLIVLNKMLLDRYGATLDYNEPVSFAQVRGSFVPSAIIVAKEQEFRMKLFNFFLKWEPKLTEPKNQQQFEKYVKFAMINGIDTVSEKLRKKFGEGLESDKSSSGALRSKEITNQAATDFAMTGGNSFGLDVDRLRENLEFFYVEMEDVEQLEVLDQVTEWACEIGIEQLDKNLEQIYGVSFTTILETNGRAAHFDFEINGHDFNGQEPGFNGQNPVFNGRVENENLEEDYQDYDIVYEDVVERNVAREFSEMTDTEIYQELTVFYERNDPDNLDQLDKILALGRQIGRKALNMELLDRFGEILTPFPEFVTRRVEHRIPKPVPKMELRPPTPPRRPNRNVVNQRVDLEAPPQRQNTFVPPPEAVLNRRQIVVGKNRPNFAISQPASENSDVKVPEFIRKQQAIRRRIDNMEAVISDGRGNVVMTVNLLIDVCKNYTLDPMSGTCKHCQFARSDHVWNQNKRV